jgi:serine phosphatase RsbU (regulator of sigma subunit)
MKISSSIEANIDKINCSLWKIRYEDPGTVFTEAQYLLARAIKADYQKGMAQARLTLAACSFLQSKNDTALENLSDALLWFSVNPSEPGYACALNLKGNLYESFGDYDKALQFCLEANKHSAELNDLETEAETCSQLGMIYTRLCNFIKALEYYTKALKIREEMKDENAVASSLNRIGMIMRMTKKYDESLDYYQKSLEIRRRNNQITSIPWTMLGIASTYEEMNIISSALDYYENGMIGGDIRCTLQCKLGSGRVFSLMGEAGRAEKELLGSLKIAQELKAMSLIAEAYSALANHYESIGQHEEALNNHKLYHKTRESVQSDDARSRLRNIEISHAVEKSEQEKEIFRLRHVELKHAFDLIEEKNKDITSSISYASRIQRAMLPEPTEIRGLSKNSLVVFLPKDIVSGDFYWFNKSGDKLIAVAGDCTGHGVPGALMSMLGISFLEEIVNYREITDSGKILDELRNEVQRALRQKGTREEAKDGMDISLCVIDSKKKTIQFSGAYNNLYFIRDNELIEYPADRMPIAIFDRADSDFKRHNIDTLPGDVIYMFSDGYADQFGGPNCKKFKYATFKALLLEIHKLPMAKQKLRLEKEFYEWKGTNTQVDDVLILGLKL